MTTRNHAPITRITWARIAGFMFLLYIIVGITGLALFGRGTSGEGAAAKLASMAQYATDVRINEVFGLVTGFIALILAVALYTITREQDSNLAMLGLICRVGEGLIGGVYIPMTLGLLSLATASGANAPDTAATHTLGSFLFTAGSWIPNVAGTFFAVGSTIFSWLLLRGRMIPVVLAWFGVIMSVLWVVGLPLQLVGVLPSSVTWFIFYLPMLVFEVTLALWLIVKGVAMPAAQNADLTSAN